MREANYQNVRKDTLLGCAFHTVIRETSYPLRKKTLDRLKAQPL